MDESKKERENVKSPLFSAFLGIAVELQAHLRALLALADEFGHCAVQPVFQ